MLAIRSRRGDANQPATRSIIKAIKTAGSGAAGSATMNKNMQELLKINREMLQVLKDIRDDNRKAMEVAEQRAVSRLT